MKKYTFEDELDFMVSVFQFDNKFDQFNVNGQTKIEVPFEIDFKYLEEFSEENGTDWDSDNDSERGYSYNFLLSHDIKKEMSGQLELIDNEFVVASFKDKKTGQPILSRRYSLEEFNQTDKPFSGVFFQEKYKNNPKERTEDITESIKNGALDISLPLEHQHFILNRLIDTTPQFAEMQERDISTTALFKKELNNLAKKHIENSLYAQNFTKQLDIPQNEIDQLIENRKIKLGLNNLKNLCEKSCNENSKEIHKISLLLENNDTCLHKMADIKMKIGKDGQDKVIKIAHDNKQYLIGADIFESKTDTFNMFYSLAEQIEKAGTENNTLQLVSNDYTNCVYDVDMIVKDYFEGIDRDLPIEKQIELGIQELDKEANKQGLKGHKELIATYFGIDSVSDTFTTELIEKAADYNHRIISESDLADIYDCENSLEKAVDCFEKLHLLSRDIKLSFIEDLKNGSLVKQAKSYEAKNGVFEKHTNHREDFFAEYLGNKVITEDQIERSSMCNIVNALSHKEDHNKHLDRVAVKHRVLRF
jgi:hypothetical protein